MVLTFLVASLLFAKDIPLPEPAIVPSVYAQQDPQIASDGHDYLAVWCRDGVRAQRISASGELIGGEFVISERAALVVRVAWAGSSYVVIYTGMYARVGAGGEVLQRDVTLGAPLQYVNAIAWNGTDLLISWFLPQGHTTVIRTTLLSADMTVIAPEILVAAAAIVPTSEGFIAFYQDRATTILNDGTVEPSTPSGVTSAVAAARSGDTILVVGADGTILNFTTGAVRRPIGFSVQNVQLAAGGSGFLLTWTNDGVAGIRLDINGEPVDAEAFPISATPYAGNFRLASNGDSYFLIWSDGRRTPFYLVQQVWGAYVRDRSAREMPIVLSPANQFAPNAAFNGSIGLVAWGEETYDEPSRVVVTRFAADGTILDPHGIEVTPMGRPSGVATDGHDFLVVWRDPEKPHDRIPLVRAALVRADGSVGPIQTLSSEHGLSQPHVTFDGENYFVIWDDGDDGQYLRRLQGARINRQGFLIDAMPLDFGLGFNPAIAFDGASERIVYLQTDHGVVTRRITREGFLLDSDATTIDPQPSSPSYPAIACDAGVCLAAWDHGDNAIDGSVLKANGDLGAAFPIASVQLVGIGPSVTSNANGFFVTWPDWNGRDLDVRGARVSPAGAFSGFVNVATTGASEAAASPAGGFVVYSRDGRLYLRTSVEGARRRATKP